MALPVAPELPGECHSVARRFLGNLGYDLGNLGVLVKFFSKSPPPPFRGVWCSAKFRDYPVNGSGVMTVALVGEWHEPGSLGADGHPLGAIFSNKGIGTSERICGVTIIFSNKGRRGLSGCVGNFFLYRWGRVSCGRSSFNFSINEGAPGGGGVWQIYFPLYRVTVEGVCVGG